MFRNRKTSRKPSDDLYRDFKAHFPSLPSGLVDATLPDITDVSALSDVKQADSLAENDPDHHALPDNDHDHDHDQNDLWASPSILDPHNQQFNFFAAHLHSNSLATPLSLPLSDVVTHSHPFHSLSLFHMPQEPAFSPHRFTHPALSPHRLTHPALDLDPPTDVVHPPHHPFRFSGTVNAPTAMIKQPGDIPITYLNKGQAYTLAIADTRPSQAASTTYRTSVRVSFEDEQQRAKPAQCWQLWKEGRGTNEAHQRGGRLQAVEYVPSGLPDDPRHPCVRVESSSLDGFCVVWSPGSDPAGNHAECLISVRFNFLSTDFSHSKGVKGIPVRLCAKTHVVEPDATPAADTAEVSYCKVKLFRDHGAERKLSNDIAHVKKTMDKLHQQLAQIESGARDPGGKRKRSGSMARTAGLDQRPEKIAKHGRTWSMSAVPTTTAAAARGTAEGDLHSRLATLQDMFSSTRPSSLLHLCGEPDDDPDAFPVCLAGDLCGSLPPRTHSIESAPWDQHRASSAASPSLSHRSGDVSSLRDPGMQQPTPLSGVSRENSGDWRRSSADTLPDPMHMPVSFPAVHATDVDSSYAPPPPPRHRPIACFYIQPHVVPIATAAAAAAARRRPPDPKTYYRAIYLFRRSRAAFVAAAASKAGVPPAAVRRAVRITPAGLCVLLDDDGVEEMPEGQQMSAVFAALDPDDNADAEGADVAPAYELRVAF